MRSFGPKYGLFILTILLSFCFYGCGAKATGSGSSKTFALRGNVHGGQQPVSGAAIQLYAVGSNGDGSQSAPLLTHAVFSDGLGNFTITGDYTCPSSGTMVYLLATGGNPGLASGTNNSGISMIAALGNCGLLQASTFITVNELTTEGAVAALAPFMTSSTGIGSATIDAPALTSAFSLASEYVNVAAGTAPGLNLPNGSNVPVAELNTVADILASCINSSGGIAGDGSPCGNLFALTTPLGGTAPTDTVMAALDLAQNPTANTTELFGLVAAETPFQPTLSTPPQDFSIQLATGSMIAISSSSLTFPNTIVGAVGSPQKIILTNNGSTTATFSGSSLLGVNAGDFSIGNSCSSGTLAAGGSCSFLIGYEPVAAGTRNATLEILSNGQTTTVPLSAVASALPSSSVPAPMADYKFLDGSGSILTDSSGNGNDGTLRDSPNAPTWTSTGLSFSGLSGSSQGVSLPAVLNTTKSFVFVTATRNLSAGLQSAPQNEVLLTNSTGAGGLIIWDAADENKAQYLASSPFITDYAPVATWGTNLTNGFHCKAVTLGSGGSDLDRIFIDGNEPVYGARGASAGIQKTGNFFIGSYGTGLNGNAAGTFYRAAFYSDELSAAQIQSACASMVSEVAGRNVATGPVLVSLTKPTIHAIGDSITFGSQAGTPYASLLVLSNQPSYTVVNWGTPTVTLLSMLASEPYRVAPQCTSSGGPVIATVLAGLNDDIFLDSTTTALMASLASEVNILKTAGCQVFVGTILSTGGTSQNGVDTLDSLKDSYDAAILVQAKSLGVKGVIDFAANPILGADGAALNDIYFNPDQIHPREIGQQMMAVAMSNTLNYYYGFTSANPHALACSASYTLASGDGALAVNPASACTLTMPDCTGPSGAVYTITNTQSVYPVTVVGGMNQPINGSTSAITVPANSTVTVTDMPNPKTISGCHWQM